MLPSPPCRKTIQCQSGHPSQSPASDRPSSIPCTWRNRHSAYSGLGSHSTLHSALLCPLVHTLGTLLCVICSTPIDFRVLDLDLTSSSSSSSPSTVSCSSSGGCPAKASDCGAARGCSYSRGRANENGNLLPCWLLLPCRTLSSAASVQASAATTADM
ncbi:hypothetical protein BZA05DRAFT_126532 [Tricharina praecox]|uniref:uncharacterized protein n=1 Tax=Tricharina praecox TaxID=43433 RepID=UPI00221E7BE7|nr:uncharacterized protein BZA05DRAFT_126532 [Tricharina praecox]KAI5847579.1 hypothetical protein BZA05DRAFT_126532 [Tricharina praecox]